MTMVSGPELFDRNESPSRTLVLLPSWSRITLYRGAEKVRAGWCTITGTQAGGPQREHPIRYQPVGSSSLPFLGGTSDFSGFQSSQVAGRRIWSRDPSRCSALSCLLHLRSSFRIRRLYPNNSLACSVVDSFFLARAYYLDCRSPLLPAPCLRNPLAPFLRVRPTTRLSALDLLHPISIIEVVAYSAPDLHVRHILLPPRHLAFRD